MNSLICARSAARGQGWHEKEDIPALTDFVVVLLIGPRPSQQFIVYDCWNGTNTIESFSLHEPAPCSSLGTDENSIERLVEAEIL
jgi:hypothetical protein